MHLFVMVGRNVLAFIKFGVFVLCRIYLCLQRIPFLSKKIYKVISLKYELGQMESQLDYAFVRWKSNMRMNRREFLQIGVGGGLLIAAGMALRSQMTGDPPSSEDITAANYNLKVEKVDHIPEIGDLVPDFYAVPVVRTDEDRVREWESIQLSELEGTVILNFAIPGCAPCHQIDRYLGALYNAGKPYGLTVIKILQGADSDGASKYLHDKTFEYPVVVDGSGLIGRQYGVEMYPHLAVIEDSILIDVNVGFGKGTPDWIRSQWLKISEGK
jgi:hypothetical protein